ncbi:MAG: Ig domain-containing protein [Gemmatimonadota bacterium]
MRRRVRPLVAGGFLLVAAFACGSADDPLGPDLFVTRVTITAGGCNTLRVGLTCELGAHAFNAAGGLVENPQLTWRTLNPVVATVNFRGVVSAVQPGTARLRVQTADPLVFAEVSLVVIENPPTPE